MGAKFAGRGRRPQAKSRRLPNPKPQVRDLVPPVYASTWSEMQNLRAALNTLFGGVITLKEMLDANEKAFVLIRRIAKRIEEIEAKKAIRLLGE